MKSWSIRILATVAVTAMLAARARADGGVTVEIVTDPALGMAAYTVHVPAGWKFQGSAFPGPPCNEIPYPVYRAYSPDGLTEMRKLPRFDWTFDSVHFARPAPNACLPLDRALSANEFLRYLTGVTGAHYAGEMSLAPRYQANSQAVLASMKRIYETGPGTRATMDTAAIRIRSKNGTFVIEQRLRAWVACNSRPWFQGSVHTACFAVVDVLRAPNGKLDALARTADENYLNTSAINPAYDVRIAQILQARGNARLAAMAQHDNEVMQAQQARFERSMAVQQHDHEQFMAQMQSATNSSMAATGAAMNARSTSASDWVDYALDRQTVTGSGGTVKISNAYAQTWSNGQGEWYQTSDPNANPNGVLGGTWTQQTRVHGNGTP